MYSTIKKTNTNIPTISNTILILISFPSLYSSSIVIITYTNTDYIKLILKYSL